MPPEPTAGDGFKITFYDSRQFDGSRKPALAPIEGPQYPARFGLGPVALQIMGLVNFLKAVGNAEMPVG